VLADPSPEPRERGGGHVISRFDRCSRGVVVACCHWVVRHGDVREGVIPFT